MGTGNILRDALTPDELASLGTRPQTFVDENNRAMTIGPIGSSAATMQVDPALGGEPPAAPPLMLVPAPGRATLDPSLLPAGAIQPPASVGLAAQPVLPGPSRYADPYAAAARQASDPSQLSPEQLILLGQKSTGPVGGSVSQSVRTSAKQLHTPELDRALADQAALTEKIAKRTEEIGRIQGESAIKVADQTAGYAGQLAERADAIQKQQAANDETLTKQAARMEEQRAQYVRDAGNIDPKRLVHGKEALVGLAQALGAFGATLGRTQNFAQQIIASKLEADLDAQKVALAAKRDNLSFAQQAYVNHSAQFTNQIAAKRAAIADSYDVFAAQLSSHAARLKGTEQEQGALNSADAFRLKAQEERTNALKLEAGTLQTQVTSQAGGQGKSQSALEKVVAAAEAKIKIDKAFGDSAEVTTQDRTQLNKVLGQVSAMGAAIDDAKNLSTLNEQTTEAGRTFPVTDAAHRHQTASNAFVNNYGRAISGANVGEQQLKSIKATVEGGAYTSGSRNVKLKELQGVMARTVAHDIATLPPKLQEEALKRASAFGIDKQLIESMRSGTAPQSGSELGTSMGFRPIE